MITWHIKAFEELTNYEIYKICVLRNAVFIVEQKCPYQDIDGLDDQCWHLWGEDGQGNLVAYLRLIPPGVTYEEASIGRVITAPAYRGQGVGNPLMEKALAFMDQQGYPILRIGAQQYARAYYEKWGFVADDDGYVEDDIPHIHMVRLNEKSTDTY